MVGEMVEDYERRHLGGLKGTAGTQLELFHTPMLSNREPVEMTVQLPPKADYMRMPECPIAREVLLKVQTRANEGMVTYGQTMERTDIDTQGWIEHTIEELLDAAAYLTRLKVDVNNVEARDYED